MYAELVRGVDGSEKLSEKTALKIYHNNILLSYRTRGCQGQKEEKTKINNVGHWKTYLLNKSSVTKKR